MFNIDVDQMKQLLCNLDSHAELHLQAVFLIVLCRQMRQRNLLQGVPPLWKACTQAWSPAPLLPVLTQGRPQTAPLQVATASSQCRLT